MAGTKSREISHTPEFQTGNYVKIGNIVFYWISIKTQINESGEYARVALPPEFPAMKDVANSSVIVGECINATERPTDPIYGFVDWNRNEITLYYGSGESAYWASNGTCWIKLSGFYIA